ncbi:hypothetical protein [Leekyejoonella antrihumi]|uniref:Uncharacterized protein n=1 Tax=Leekyejoonella antrihumi TaxID=1660198 RepID=A0A563E074_9MICO|nr:hypothetical protein [Leekyejoonella antrihumi]TWP35611.1 hypothetical protein FGL98_13625 [Leekyejoonella antrihumi]
MIWAIADFHGRVQRRIGGDATLVTSMDAVFLPPGYSCREDEVGTNGIGTALESDPAARCNAP